MSLKTEIAKFVTKWTKIDKIEPKMRLTWKWRPRIKQNPTKGQFWSNRNGKIWSHIFVQFMYDVCNFYFRSILDLFNCDLWEEGAWIKWELAIHDHPHFCHLRKLSFVFKLGLQRAQRELLFLVTDWRAGI